MRTSLQKAWQNPQNNTGGMLSIYKLNYLVIIYKLNKLRDKEVVTYDGAYSRITHNQWGRHSYLHVLFTGKKTKWLRPQRHRMFGFLFLICTVAIRIHSPFQTRLMQFASKKLFTLISTKENGTWDRRMPYGERVYRRILTTSRWSDLPGYSPKKVALQNGGTVSEY